MKYQCGIVATSTTDEYTIISTLLIDNYFTFTGKIVNRNQFFLPQFLQTLHPSALSSAFLALVR